MSVLKYKQIALFRRKHILLTKKYSICFKSYNTSHNVYIVIFYTWNLENFNSKLVVSPNITEM